MAAHKYRVLERDALSYARNIGDIVEIDDSIVAGPLANGWVELVCNCSVCLAFRGAISKNTNGKPVEKLTKAQLQAKAKNLKLVFNTKTTNA